MGTVKKSDYKPKPVANDGSIEMRQMDEIEKFLDTFFSVYPKADAEELSQYVKKQALKPIQHNSLVFSEILNPIYRTEGKETIVYLIIKSLDQETKMVQLLQYRLALEKNDNWFISGS